MPDVAQFMRDHCIELRRRQAPEEAGWKHQHRAEDSENARLYGILAEDCFEGQAQLRCSTGSDHGTNSPPLHEPGDTDANESAQLQMASRTAGSALEAGVAVGW